MDELKFNGSSTDAMYLLNVNRFFTALFVLAIFKNGWPEEKLGSQGVLEGGLNFFKQMFEGGLTGNRLNIAARKTARHDLDVRIQKILHYLTVMADESEIAALINAGVVRYTSRKRARKAAKAAVAH